MGLLSELWHYMRERKKWWLLPVIIVMVVLGGLLIFAQGLGAGAVHLHDFLGGLGAAKRCGTGRGGQRRDVLRLRHRSAGTCDVGRAMRRFVSRCW